MMPKSTLVLVILSSSVLSNPVENKQERIFTQQREEFEKKVFHRPPTVEQSFTKPESSVQLEKDDQRATQTLSCQNGQIQFNGICVSAFTQSSCPDGTWVVVKEGVPACTTYPRPCSPEVEKSVECLQALVEESEKFCDVTKGMKIVLKQSGDTDCICRNGYIYLNGSCYESSERGLCPEGHDFAEIPLDTPTTKPAEVEAVPTTTTRSRDLTEERTTLTSHVTERQIFSSSSRKSILQLMGEKLTKAAISIREFFDPDDEKVKINREAVTTEPSALKTTTVKNLRYIDEMDNTLFSYLGHIRKLQNYTGARSTTTSDFHNPTHTVQQQIPSSGDSVTGDAEITETSTHKAICIPYSRKLVTTLQDKELALPGTTPYDKTTEKSESEDLLEGRNL